jgi:hypothetical protein
MKPLILATTCGLALTALAACTPGGPPAARAALDCPETQGDLKRTSVAPDGKTCGYVTRDGDEISLRLIPVTTGYQAALAPIEAELRAEVQTDKAVADSRSRAAEDGAKAAAVAKSGASAARDAAEAARQAADDALSEAKDARDNAKDAGESGANTHIDLPGIHIDADDSGKADVDVGMIHVNAGDDGATVRMLREVRLRGEALSREKRGFRASFILAQDNLKDGWRAVGYQAGGPKTGPITVAVVKSRFGGHHDILDDVKRLVRRNSGA